MPLETAEGRHFAGPSLISDKVVTTSTDDLHNIISNGKGRMPKFATKLTSEEIDGLVSKSKVWAKKNEKNVVHYSCFCACSVLISGAPAKKPSVERPTDSTRARADQYRPSFRPEG